jgi:sugar phosphate isomerase/epimerase
MKTLKTITVLLAIAMTLPCFAQTRKTVTFNPPKVVKDAVLKNVGLQLYSLRDDIGRNSENIKDMIGKAGSMGYKYVEAANYNDGKFYGLTPEEFKATLAVNGMYALSSHTGHALAKDISQTNWDEVWAWWDKCIADHKAAGMKYIVTPSMPQPETLEGLQAYCDYYNKIGEKCEAAGLKFGYHNHSYEFEKKYPDGTVMYDYMVSHTDPSKVFFEMDVYWAVMGHRAPVELFNKYPGRFVVLHIKDDKELGESGMVGFDAIFKHIQTAGTKYLIVEVERYNLPPVESIKASLDYLNNAPFVKKDYSK